MPPERAFDTDPELRWMFVFPHPDDEVAVGAWIRRLAEAGNPVHLCWMHAPAQRRAESERVCDELLGVPKERRTFLSAEDGRMAESLSDLFPRVREAIQQSTPDRVATVAFEQGHLDHDSVNVLVNTAFEGPVFEWPMYHPYTRRVQTLNAFADPQGEEVLPLTREEWLLKRRLARSYPSQTIYRNVWWYGLYRRACGRPVYLDRFERMRAQTHRDLRAPNLPPTLAHQVTRSRSWARWLEAVARFESSR